MFNKKLFKEKVALARAMYKEFRLYDLGSYALKHFTSKKGYQLAQDIAYGPKVRQQLDLFRSLNPRKQQPLIVFVHGGAWSHGDKKDYAFIGEAFAREGFDVAILNYHLAPTHIFPRSIDDLHVALNYLDQYQLDLGIQTKKIILMGHSAGAFNIMSVLYHPTQFELSARERICGAIGIAGPYHFDYKDDPLCAHAFDQAVPYTQVMPYYFVEHNHTKHYLLTAANDTIVHPKNALDFDEMLKEKGNHSQLIEIKRTGHITIIGSVATLFSRFFDTKPQIMQALQGCLED